MTEEQCKKLKVGDKVRCCTRDFLGRSPKVEIGDIGIVSSIYTRGTFRPYVEVDFENAGKSRECWAEEIELLPTHSFKVGDKVRVHKPNDTDEHPGWVSSMDEFDGREYVIKEIYEDNDIRLDGTYCWEFHKKWLELVEPVKEGEEYEPIFKIHWELPLTTRKLSPEFPSLTTRTMRKLSELSFKVRKAFDDKKKALFQVGMLDNEGKWTSMAKERAEEELKKERIEKWLTENESDLGDEAIEDVKLHQEDCE